MIRIWNCTQRIVLIWFGFILFSICWKSTNLSYDSWWCRDLLYKPIVLCKPVSALIALKDMNINKKVTIFLFYFSSEALYLHVLVELFVLILMQAVDTFHVFGVCINPWMVCVSHIVRFAGILITIFLPSVKCFISCSRRCILSPIRLGNCKF